MNYKDFWVRLYPELEYKICFGSLSTSSWLPKSKGNSFFQPTRCHQNISRHNVSLSPERILSGQNFQNFDFWGTQNFLRLFLPSFGWVLLVAWPRAPAPRHNSAALRSPQRPRFRGRAAPRGEGGRGCTEHRGLQPRRRSLGDSVVRKWMKMLTV